jgi:dihydrodipicolinate synthase/N-acetylneuraminate lyase
MELPLKGIIPPVITPLVDSNTLDVNGLEKLIEHIISGGVHGIFILGTTGEATSLTYELRKELIKYTTGIVNHRIPVLVGITDTSIKGSLDIAEYSAAAGADCLVIAPPYYIPISQEEMREYLENIVPKLPLPFMMYDMPSCTKLHLSLETVRRSKDLGAIGIKDSSGDMSYLYSLINEFRDSPEFSIIAGTELFLPETIIHGGHGAVAGGANLYPKLFADLYNASLERDMDKIEKLRELVIMIDSTIYNVGKHKSRIIKGIKCALSVMDICDDYVALPLQKFKEEEKRIIVQHVKDLSKVIS